MELVAVISVRLTQIQEMSKGAHEGSQVLHVLLICVWHARDKIRQVFFLVSAELLNLKGIALYHPELKPS
jgi:hypothetical protein